MQHRGPFVSPHGLDSLGIEQVRTAHWSLPTPALYEESVRRGEARVAKGGPLVALTGVHTGRSPNDKFFARESSTEDDIWWGNVNRPIDAERFDSIEARMMAHFKDKDVFVQDCFAGADSTYRLPIRVISEYAWHSLFARNLFNFLNAFWDKDEGRPVLDEEIGDAIRLTRDGAVVHPKLAS